ncbi:MAG: hypothetical protein IT190_00690, partial [Microbacteriaceae bacterium]|nr:hypothetical protein [Microbacteriaceae bacterium]
MTSRAPNLDLDASIGAMSRLRSGVETKTGKIILAATLFGLGSSALAGCSENVSASPEPSVSHSETVKEKTIDQKIQEKIAERPKEGTPEYEAIFAPMIIPYVEGQPPEEVVQELHNVMLL